MRVDEEEVGAAIHNNCTGLMSMYLLKHAWIKDVTVAKRLSSVVFPFLSDSVATELEWSRNQGGAE